MNKEIQKLAPLQARASLHNSTGTIHTQCDGAPGVHHSNSLDDGVRHGVQPSDFRKFSNK